MHVRSGHGAAHTKDVRRNRGAIGRAVVPNVVLFVGLKGVTKPRRIKEPLEK
jgi:hypothetical protein